MLMPNTAIGIAAHGSTKADTECCWERRRPQEGNAKKRERGTGNPLRVGTRFRLTKDVAACPCLSFHCEDDSPRSGDPLITGQSGAERVSRGLRLPWRNEYQ